MKLVLDTNIFFSLLNPGSAASYVFASLYEPCFAPAHIRSEFNKHLPECFQKSKLSRQEFELRLNELEQRISFQELSVYKENVSLAFKSQPDQRDAPFLALALRWKAAIWSNDSDFKKQTLVPVYTTKELLAKLWQKEL